MCKSPLMVNADLTTGRSLFSEERPDLLRDEIVYAMISYAGEVSAFTAEDNINDDLVK